MKKTLIVTCCFVALICMAFGFTKQERLYKNLKILPKNITKVELDSVMKHFTTSLGVKCNFCHVRNADNTQWDFPSDANKHKLVAREMMEMTTKINKKYFDHTGSKPDPLYATLEVNCYTCHHGSPEPPHKPETK